MTTTVFGTAAGVLLLFSVAIIVASVHAYYIEKRIVPSSSSSSSSSTYVNSQRQLQPIADPRKRPFCNAFTGCGKKRSVGFLPSAMLQEGGAPLEAVTGGGGGQQQIADQLEEESIATLIDLSSEPAVEDITRQIMSEAKLWEAIQEANVELMRRRQQEAAAVSVRGDVDGLPSRGPSYV